MSAHQLGGALGVEGKFCLARVRNFRKKPQAEIVTGDTQNDVMERELNPAALQHVSFSFDLRRGIGRVGRGYVPDALQSEKANCALVSSVSRGRSPDLRKQLSLGPAQRSMLGAQLTRAAVPRKQVSLGPA